MDRQVVQIEVEEQLEQPVEQVMQLVPDWEVPVGQEE
jgi:hypothetical protein